MDNLGSHKSKAVRRAIRAAGARLLFLPKYSPDLNPIEQLFSKLKHWLRRAAGRTADAVCNALGPILETVTPHECSNYFTTPGTDKRKFIPLYRPRASALVGGRVSVPDLASVELSALPGQTRPAFSRSLPAWTAAPP